MPNQLLLSVNRQRLLRIIITRITQQRTSRLTSWFQSSLSLAAFKTLSRARSVSVRYAVLTRSRYPPFCSSTPAARCRGNPSSNTTRRRMS
ncbi:hypothetical protein ATCV1_z749L [Acanthocystis turfacea chlorella virus 1]|uniref:Uncharacterized protein z749L n=1 Tax=Chlorovirus heliozoae TaxID=322019 RepID=A7KA09_9PHYC|nr:hypothetical protein ATCV1_z749L [Acanthocystis turfacea chlorella virus 1]ABT16883.1 hypothetical protein ATCV1_z749L [Acanthocystis turfacea chlorella virus 1]